MPVIYLDVLIVLNWFIDYLLLSLTARLLHTEVCRFRVVLAGAIGGLASCQLLLTVAVPVSVILHIAGAALMVFVAFHRCGWRGYLKQVLTFFCVSALLSGLVTVGWRVFGDEVVLTRNGVIYCDISPLMLTALAVLSYGVVRLYERLTRKRVPSALEYIVTIDDGSGCCVCRALYDSGLHLREPFSGAPVIVVNPAALRPYLSDRLQQALYAAAGGAVSSGVSRLRMIPYRTVGGNGLLPAFVPSLVTVKRGGDPARDISGVYVALSEELQSGEYTALIGGDVLDGV